MITRYLRRKIIFSFALLWELVRLGLLWNMNRVFIEHSFGTINSFYLMWLIAPALAVISGYLIVLYQPDAKTVCIVLVNSRGFQAVFGILAILTILAGSTSFTDIGTLMLILLMDMLFLFVQLMDITRD
jgi:hypothetical protein